MLTRLDMVTCIEGERKKQKKTFSQRLFGIFHCNFWLQQERQMWFSILLLIDKYAVSTQQIWSVATFTEQLCFCWKIT